MAKAIQCDRCYAYFSENKEIPINGTDTFLVGITYRIQKRNSPSVTNGRAFDLCDDCLKKINDFMEFRADFVSKASGDS